MGMRRKVLVVDDDEMSCKLVKMIFEGEGLDVIVAHEGRSGLDRVIADAPDVVLLDLEMPGMGGAATLEQLKISSPELPIIMVTAHRELEHAISALKHGAFDYLTKPIDHDTLIAVVHRALETSALRTEVRKLRQRVAGQLGEQMGPGPQISEVIEQVKTVARSSLTVLLLGETGTGKDLVAQALHRESDRRSKPFVAVDCGAIPEALLESELFGHEKGAFSGAERRKEGMFQLAEGGTFFLDEVGNLSFALQAKLLRVLESRQVQAVGATRATDMDVRFVAATNLDLQRRVGQGQFRSDLYFRLAQYTISLPGLRERPIDIPHLAQRFLEEARVELKRPVQQLADDAVALLQEQRWPGNVRELRNVVRQAVLRAKELVIERATVQALLGIAGDPQIVQVTAHAPIEGRSLKEIAEAAAADAERHAIRETLRATAGNKAEAARRLRTDYKTLHLKMKSLGIDAQDFTT
jgi:DNA-binding NtrC family response regulator